MSGVEFSIDASALDAFATRMGAAPAVIEKEVGAMLGRVGIAGVGIARPLTPVDTGQLRAAWTTEPVNPFQVNIVNGKDYAAVVNNGRRAGAPMPPSGALLGWMGRHGIDASAEYPLRRAIGARGIAGKHMLEQTVAQLGPVIEKEAAAAGERIVAELGAAA